MKISRKFPEKNPNKRKINLKEKKWKVDTYDELNEQKIENVVLNFPKKNAVKFLSFKNSNFPPSFVTKMK